MHHRQVFDALQDVSDDTTISVFSSKVNMLPLQIPNNRTENHKRQRLPCAKGAVSEAD
jgi:hypothetical protein